MSYLNDLLSKVKESTLPIAVPGVLSSVQKLVSSLCSISNRVQSTEHVLEDTDSDEESSSCIQARCKHFHPARMLEKEKDLFFKYFPSFVVPEISPQANVTDKYKELMQLILQSFENLHQTEQTILLPEITYEDIISMNTQLPNDFHKYLASNVNDSVDLLSLIQGISFSCLFFKPFLYMFVQNCIHNNYVIISFYSNWFFLNYIYVTCIHVNLSLNSFKLKSLFCMSSHA